MRLYTLYLRKNKNEPAPSMLITYLRKFMIDISADGLFIMPGHLSSLRNKEGDPSINHEKLLDAVLDGTDPKDKALVKLVGFGNAYQDDTGENIKRHEEYLTAKGIDVLKVKRNNDSDHSKMIFVFRMNKQNCGEQWDISQELTQESYREFLRSIDVVGVVTGSTNFSYSGYGDREVSGFRAYNGESDILMFGDDAPSNAFARSILAELGEADDNQNDTSNAKTVDNYNACLSKNLSRVEDDFFAAMLDTVLKHTLETKK